jgi:hypothetical protein
VNAVEEVTTGEDEGVRVEPDTTNREEEAAVVATTRKKDSPTICSTFHQRYFLKFSLYILLFK